MSTYRVELTKLCQRQIREIEEVLKIDLQNPQAADRFIDETMNLVLSLEQFPKRYAVRPYSIKYGDYEIRQVCFVMNYTAYYIVDDVQNLVIITEIRYSRQDSSDL